MSTQELIELLRERALDYALSREHRPLKPTSMLLDQAAAELEALRGKLEGVHRFAERIAKQPLAEQARKDHEDEGHDGEPDFEGAYDAIIEQARAAIAAYLAAVRDKG